MSHDSISDERLAELAARIKPVIRFAEGRFGLFESDDGWLYYVEDKPDLRNYAYAWDAVPTERAPSLEALGEIVTHHSYGAPSFFKPSIAEVLSQIPDRFIDKVVAFEVTDGRMGAASNEHHDATTILYGATS